jgi:hypothetical protein
VISAAHTGDVGYLREQATAVREYLATSVHIEIIDGGRSCSSSPTTDVNSPDGVLLDDGLF